MNKKQKLIEAIRELAAAGTQNIDLGRYNLTQLREILHSLKLSTRSDNRKFSL